MNRLRLAAASLALAVSFPVLAGPPMSKPAPHLRAHPSVTTATLPPGETALANGTVAYRPATSHLGPLPVIVLLHGAGGYPTDFLERLEPVADRLGAILLEPHSEGRTWDVVENMEIGEDPWRGPDAHRIDQSLADLFSRTAVDPSRVVLLGFSDGASYALSLGLSNPQLFTGVIALSPGMMAPPYRFSRSQQVFIAHGRNDTVLPFATTRDIADQLRRAGENVRFKPFEGNHQIDPAILTEALEWTLRLPPLQR